MKIVIYEKAFNEWMTYKIEEDWPLCESSGFCINPFITATLVISNALGLTGKVIEGDLFDEDIVPIFKAVSYFGCYFQGDLYVPFTGIANSRFKIPEKVHWVLVERFELMTMFNFQAFGGMSLHENPDFLVFNCLDYAPMDGVAEALYGGFFVQGLEKWNYYFIPRGQFPTKKVLDSAKGIVITGSRHNCDVVECEWKEELLRVLIEFSGKIVGICFGHQIVAKAFGSEIVRNPTGEYIYKVEEVRGRGELRIMQSHGFCVESVPDGFERVFSSESCEVEGLRFENKILTVQGHPEYTEEFVKKFHSVMMKKRGLLSDEKFESIQSISEGSFSSLEILTELNSFIRTGSCKFFNSHRDLV